MSILVYVLIIMFDQPVENVTYVMEFEYVIARQMILTIHNILKHAIFEQLATNGRRMAAGGGTGGRLAYAGLSDQDGS